METSKQDWKLFREKLPGWQEAYMDRLNQEYMTLLSGDGSPSKKFWALYDRIRQDKQCRGVILQLKKANVAFDLAALICDGVISHADLDEFSQDLRDTVQHLCSRTL